MQLPHHPRWQQQQHAYTFHLSPRLCSTICALDFLFSHVFNCSTICVLGVDFMSENVRAILDEAGFTNVAVYRMASDPIGCSLAEAAESEQYMRCVQLAVQAVLCC